MTERLFRTLDLLLQRLWNYLDTILSNLEALRQYLLRKLDRLLRLLESIKDKLVELAKIGFFYILIIMPPVIGFFLAAVLYSVPLLVMTTLLVLLLGYAFVTRDIMGASTLLEGGDRHLVPVGPSTRLFGAIITALVLFVVYWISVGLFIGFLLFIAEFAVVYFVRQEYSFRPRTDSPLAHDR